VAALVTWMAGTSPAMTVIVAAAITMPVLAVSGFSTGQPWIKPGHDELVGIIHHLIRSAAVVDVKIFETLAAAGD
jgi:hypothetical protein